MLSSPRQKPFRGIQLNKSYPITRGLVGCWVMNEGTGDMVFDLSGNGNNGTIAGASWVTGGLDFDGDNDFTSCGNDASLNITDAITLKAQVKKDESSRTESIISKGPYSLKIGADNKPYVEFIAAPPGGIWTEKAPQLGAETYIFTLSVYNGKLYGGTYPNGKLYEWNGVNAWVEKAPQLGAETYISSLVVYNGKLYGGTHPNGKLYEWNGINAWVEKAPQLGAETHIFSLVVYNDKLYGGTALNGKLYEWNGVNAWVEKAPQLGAETYIFSLVVYNGKLYGGTYPNGKLYEWNGVNAWVEKAPQLGAENHIFSLVVYNDKLYGGTVPNGKLYEWNGVNAWVEKAPKLGAEDQIRSLVVYNDKLYGGTALNGKLYEWNGVNAWVEKAPQLGAETYIFSLVVYNGKLYGGTALNGKLYEYGDGVAAYSDIAIDDFTTHNNITGSYDGSVAKIYIADVLKGNTSNSITIDTGTDNLLIGASLGSSTGGTSSSGEENFKGTIYNSSIYNRAISATEVAYLNREPYAMFQEEIESSLLYSDLVPIIDYGKTLMTMLI